MGGITRLAAMIVAGLVCGIVLAGAARSLTDDEVAALYTEMGRLYSAGKHSEATEIAIRVLASAEMALGPEHQDVGAAAGILATLYKMQGRYTDAEPLYRRRLAIWETLKPDDPDVGMALNDLAELYRLQGRYSEAEPLQNRSLANREKALGPDHPDVGTSLNNLAIVYHALGRYAEAEPLLKRSLAIREKTLGPAYADVGQTLNNTALLYRDQGRYAEAEPLLKRSLAIREKVLGPDHPDVGTSLNSLAVLYRDQGRYAEAEPLLKRSLAIREKTLGPDHPLLALSLNNVAALYKDQGRYAEAEPLHKRSLAIREKALGTDHLDVGQSLNNLADLYNHQGRDAEAEPLLRRSLAIIEKAFGPDHRYVSYALDGLALSYGNRGRYAEAEAEALYQRSLAIREKALGPDHPEVGIGLNNLARLYDSQGRDAEAEPIFKQALTVTENALGADHPDVNIRLSNLAGLYFERRDWVRAADFWRRSTGVIVRRAQRGTDDVGHAMTGKRTSEAEQLSWQFRGLVKAVHRLASGDRAAETSLAQEMFETAQWASESEAAASLAQMAARGAKGEPGLATIVRERQDLVAEWQKLDGVRTAAVTQTPDKRDRAAEAANITRLASIDTRIAEIDKRLVAGFPDYAALARPTPLSVEEVQAQLGTDEALVLFLETDARFKPVPGETFIWVVTGTDMRWVRSDLGTAELTREVAALRCGLDGGAWEGDGAAKCADLLGIAPDKAPKGNAPLPFDTGRAHTLYKALLGPVEDLIRDKHLLIVPSGPLTQLPFQLLVTAASATSGDYRAAAWLARRHAITVLPAVSSLKALRRVAKASTATKPMIGFGNPLLDGDPKQYSDHAELAELARSKQACVGLIGRQVASATPRSRGAAQVPSRNGRADLAHLRSQAPLHDTADELCAVAKDLKLAPDDIVLGTNATEATVKRLSDQGKLAQYRVLHFATHGTLAGEIEGTHEPGLILTPPKEQSDLDDGYLSASEVAALKLDADWVILSACNTAAGGAQGAEALSGLARAFFYAGARAMLVSHWSVDSAATVKLITHAVGATTRDRTLGRAEALRRAMLTMIDKGEAREAHPAYWAPFVVVGEGAAAK